MNTGIFYLMIKYYKEVIIFVLICLIAFASLIISNQKKELAVFDQRIVNIQKEYDLKIEQLNAEAVVAQEKYNALEELHKQQIKLLNSKLLDHKHDSKITYDKLVNTNNRLHNEIRDSNNRLSKLSRDAAIDYSKRTAEVFKQCSARYIELARTAEDLQVDRNNLEDAYPKQLQK